MMRRILILTASGLAVAVLIIAVLPPAPILVAARALALLTILHLIWRYHFLADWSVVPIGRSTMAIKAAILIIAIGANLRTLDDYTTLDVHAAAEIGIVLGWLAMAAALIHRDRLVVEMQGQAHALPAPPPTHYLPSEAIKEEQP